MTPHKHLDPPNGHRSFWTLPRLSLRMQPASCPQKLRDDKSVLFHTATLVASMRCSKWQPYWTEDLLC